MRGFAILILILPTALAWVTPASTLLPREASTQAPTKSDSSTLRSRKDFLSAGLASLGLVSAFTPCHALALDMDAFVNSELASDKAACNPKLDPKCAPKMSEDEAMCKVRVEGASTEPGLALISRANFSPCSQYGQSGEKRGEACKRYKAASGASLGGGGKVKSLGGAYAM